MAARKPLTVLILALLSTVGCGDDDDDDASEAQLLGVGADCMASADCPVVRDANDQEVMLECLVFKGGYCGLTGCADDLDCPQGSACVAHDDGNNYCFLVCTDKPQCNWGRPVDAESNCSSNITFTDQQSGGLKACVPPTG